MKHQNNADNLADLIRAITAANRAGDEATAAELSRGVFPSLERVRGAFVANLPPGFDESLGKMYAKRPPAEDTQTWARLLNIKPSRTEVTVYTATGAEIAAYEPGSVARAAFPEMAQKVAQGGLRPDAVFHEVEATEPGADSGTKLHLFYWDGEGWVMIGPVWKMPR